MGLHSNWFMELGAMIPRIGIMGSGGDTASFVYIEELFGRRMDESLYSTSKNMILIISKYHLIPFLTAIS